MTRRGAARIAAAGFIVLSAWASTELRADVKAGVEAYKGGDFETALREFQSLAENGDARAQYNLAVMYLKGRGVARDIDKALAWQRRAADQGLAAAQHGLGVMYYRGDGMTHDFTEAARWFRRAADQGYSASQLNLGVMHAAGQGVPKDEAEAVKWLTLAAARGLPEALFRLGTMYEHGTMFRASTGDAIYWYEKAAARGHKSGQERADALRGSLSTAAADRDVAAAKRTDGDQSAPPAASIDARSLAKDAAATAEQAAAARLEPAAGSARATKRQPTMAPPGAPKVAAGATAPPEVAVPATTTRKIAPAPVGGSAYQASSAGKWLVQLASYRSVEEARRAWDRLKQAHKVTLAGLDPHFSRVDLGPQRGVFHRLRAGPLADRRRATELCNQLRSRAPSQGCLPRRRR